MNLTNWTITILGIGISLLALIFSLFQYFNKRGGSKVHVLRKSLFWGAFILLVFYLSGYWVIVNNKRIEKVSIQYEERIYKIFGRVVDDNTLKPIHAAKITINGQDLSLPVYTDSEGVFVLYFTTVNLNTEVQITVEASGFKMFTKTTFLSENTKFEDIRLNRDI